MRNRKSAGDIFPSLLSGIVGVIVGVIIVLTVITPNMHSASNEVIQPSRPHEACESSSVQPTKSLFKYSKTTDTKSIPDAVDKVSPAVVTIDTTTLKRVYERGRLGLPAYNTRIMEIPKGMGTGVIVSRDGHIVTNNHVINGAKTINVTLNDKRQYVARIIGTDPISDIAILKINDDKPFPVAELSSSENVRIGEPVVTIGNPLGVGQTVTTGVLSARGRHINDNSVELRDLLQTDAAINPGNSGGPLINVQGRVIGINTAIIPYAQGIGFAIPAELVIRIIENIQKNGRVVRPYLGIEMADLTPSMYRYFELSQETKGIIVGRILTNGPADKAGLETGDIITNIAGKEVDSTYTLQSIVRSMNIGDVVKIQIIRNNQQLEVELVLEEAPMLRNAQSTPQNIKTASNTAN